MISCKYCGKEFKRTHHSQKSCENCRIGSVTRCPTCKREFKRRSSGQKHCSNLCGNRNMSDERKRKIGTSNSKALKGKKHTEETRRKMSKSRKGIKLGPHSEETKMRMSKAQIRRWQDIEERERMSKLSKERWKDEEFRESFTEANKGKPAWNRGMKASEETRRKLSKSHKQYWANLSDEEKEEVIRRRLVNWDKHMGDTSIEIAMRELLESLNIKYQTQVYLNDGERGYFVDIYVPSKNTIIECNGDYWHSLPERIERDKQLQQYCDNQGIKLFWVWESDIRKDPYKALKKTIRAYENGIINHQYINPNLNKETSQRA